MSLHESEQEQDVTEPGSDPVEEEGSESEEPLSAPDPEEGDEVSAF